MVTLGGCNDDEGISVPNHAPTYSVKMGGIFPFTGGLSEKGKPRHQAALLAVEHLTEAGFSVGWVVADSETIPETGVKVARELIEKGGAKIIIGAASSGVTIAIAKQVTIPNQVPQISYSSTSVEITDLEDDKNRNFLFRTVVSDKLQGGVLAKLAFDKGYKRVSVLYVDDPYGRDLNESFTKRFKELGGEEVVAAAHEQIGGSDLTDNQKAKDILLAGLQEAHTGETEALIAMSYSQYVKVFLPM
ncbi:MAG: hypothetical protein DRQ57_19355, partial [Gammaproteobacteria bacterium]